MNLRISLPAFLSHSFAKTSRFWCASSILLAFALISSVLTSLLMTLPTSYLKIS